MYYVVLAGLETGIFESWAECKRHVHGVTGARWGVFESRKDAETYWTTHGRIDPRKQAMPEDLIDTEPSVPQKGHTGPLGNWLNRVKK